MRSVASDLHVHEAPQRFFGLQVGARMTVVRLPSGGLFVHSPVAATPELVAAVGALGPVRCIAAPNRFHHLHVGDWKAAFPSARLLGAPGLRDKRPDLVFDGVLDDAPEPALEGAVDHVCLRGMPMLNEVLFFHRSSATLIATDLGFNVQEPLTTRVVMCAGGCTHPMAPTLLERLAIRDRPAFAASLQRALGWPFERAIIAHGAIVDGDVHAWIRKGYRFLGPL